MTTDYTNQLLKVAESQIGYSEIGNGYTKFGQWFQDTHAKEPGYTNAAWCDMFVSWAAKQVGQQDIVGQDAWTVTHAKWFENQGAWGTTPKPGALVFYNWKGAKNIDSIEHVGLVKGVIAKDKIQTIEGNISNSVVMKTRTTDDVVGYGYPDVVNEKKQQQLLAKKAEKAKDADAKTVKVAKAKDAEAAEVDPLKVVEKAKPADTETTEVIGEQVTATGTEVGVSKSAAEQLGHPDGPMVVGGIVLPLLVLVAVAKKTRMDKWLAQAPTLNRLPTLLRFRRDRDTP